MNINNGARVEVEMPGFKGMAGLVGRADRDELAIEAPLRSLRVRPGEQITVAGLDRAVTSIAASPFLRGFVVLELKK